MSERPMTLRRLKRRLATASGRTSPAADALTPAAARFLMPIGPADPSKPAGPQVVLLNDCRDQINFGANALVDGLIEILSRSMPTATIFPIPSYWLIDTAHG